MASERQDARACFIMVLNDWFYLFLGQYWAGSQRKVGEN